MKKLTQLLLVTLALSACMTARQDQAAVYDKDPFFLQFASPVSGLDRAIASRIDSIRMRPASPVLHNQLGALLAEKRAYSKAEREFEMAIDADPNFYPAWYNLGLVRTARGNDLGAARAFRRTVSEKPGHAEAHFELAVIAERHGHTSKAIDHLAAAIAANHQILDVQRNPKILDTRLVAQALTKLYPLARQRALLAYHPAPPRYQDETEGASSQPDAASIVAPAAPTTDPASQTPRP